LAVDAKNPDLWSARFANKGPRSDASRNSNAGDSPRAGLASFLQASLERTQCALIPVLFSSKTNSDLGWTFVGAVETARF
jgi:hypothetical protein